MINRTAKFPISRDPPEGGTKSLRQKRKASPLASFQFLGIPPKGERYHEKTALDSNAGRFPISRDPPEGGTRIVVPCQERRLIWSWFPISRDPPEGGTLERNALRPRRVPDCFQFLGIPPKGELGYLLQCAGKQIFSFQFLGIPPKGERSREEFKVTTIPILVSNF